MSNPLFQVESRSSIISTAKKEAWIPEGNFKFSEAEHGNVQFELPIHFIPVDKKLGDSWNKTTTRIKMTDSQLESDFIYVPGNGEGYVCFVSSYKCLLKKNGFIKTAKLNFDNHRVIRM